ncbi:MAG TPA: gamma-aminobutyraldehyde dehydrogenase [Acidimicrobiales bacterium]|jgi:betaine-aldehyde dehydrogenase|nr:gamma-aminobutyraldehyde dehydrogenase [Acidimicrobiales bacterium]
MDRLENFVGGTKVAPKSGKYVELVNPSTGEAYTESPVSGEDDVDFACATALEAFATWRRTTPSERSRALLRIADAIEANAAKLVAIESENTGKPVQLTLDEEIPPMVDQIRFFAAAARLLEGRGAAEYMAGHTSYVRREPIGVCAAVTPWNYPMMMAVWKWAPALAAGNTMVLKPSDTTPVSTLFMAELMAEFLPPGVLNVICGDRATGRLVVEHEVPQMVSVTGSVRAGREVAASAAPTLKKVHLELGGKAPVIMFDDVDLAAAAEAIAIAGYFNAGQDCTAATRVLAGPKVYADAVDALAEQARNTSTGPPEDEDVLYGPVNNVHQLERVTGFLERRPSHATVAAGGARVGDRGFFFEPTVVAGLHQDDEMIQSEIFGPVITVQKFSDEAEALAYANGVEYGLASSVWTADHGRALRMARDLDFGCVWINTHIPLVAEMPHGGFKHSGYGKDLSVYGFEDYTRVKHVMHHLGE